MPRRPIGPPAPRPRRLRSASPPGGPRGARRAPSARRQGQVPRGHDEPQLARAAWLGVGGARRRAKDRARLHPQRQALGPDGQSHARLGAAAAPEGLCELLGRMSLADARPADGGLCVLEVTPRAAGADAPPGPDGRAYAPMLAVLRRLYATAAEAAGHGPHCGGGSPPGRRPAAAAPGSAGRGSAPPQPQRQERRLQEDAGQAPPRAAARAQRLGLRLRLGVGPPRPEPPRARREKTASDPLGGCRRRADSDSEDGSARLPAALNPKAREFLSFISDGSASTASDDGPADAPPPVVYGVLPLPQLPQRPLVPLPLFHTLPARAQSRRQVGVRGVHRAAQGTRARLRHGVPPAAAAPRQAPPAAVTGVAAHRPAGAVHA